MPAHADLTGADLHEPKGASSAGVDTVYVSDGAGSGAWEKIDASSIDTSTIFTVNKFFLTSSLTDVSAPSSIWVPVPVACTLTKVVSVLQTAITTANSVVTVANYAGTTIGTFTVAFSGSASGDVDTLACSSNNTFLADTFVKITTDGGSTVTSEIKLLLEFTQTS